ncbi:MAG: TetR family transcriptional regulator C-terminal domain-containing protein [Clostridia bacterium]|nr:TetR family transcriptional regulator C-terminal domain-containing protein [Clostridia bacterium]
MGKLFSQFFIKKCIDKGLTDENKRQYYLIFFRNGIKSITYKWMKNGFDKSAEEISEIIYDCFPTSLK